MLKKYSKKHLPVDLSQVKQVSIKSRSNKTNVKSFGKPVRKSGQGFFDGLPKFLKASELNEFIQLVIKARKNNLPFHLLLGAHTIKVGLAPVIIDLMKANIVTGISFNGAGLIHDLELAFFGGTSEDVQKGLNDGSFGMVKETAQMYSAIAALACEKNIGLGEAGGMFINKNKAKYRKLSLFAEAQRLGLSATVHVGIGTDIVTQHPEFDGAKVGLASHTDFRILADICADLNRGGALANIGSAVILPEVFLKALTVARNIKKQSNKLVTANFDMITHYRPTFNIVTRPTKNGGSGFNFVGHHEIMIPLLAWGLKQKI